MQILVLNGVRVLGIFPGVHPGVLFLITGYQIYLSIYDMFHIYSFSSSKLFVCLETFLCFLHQFDRAFVSRARCLGLYLLCSLWYYTIQM